MSTRRSGFPATAPGLLGEDVRRAEEEVALHMHDGDLGVPLQAGVARARLGEVALFVVGVLDDFRGGRLAGGRG